MAWCRPGDKPLSEPTMLNLLMPICVIRPQWINSLWPSDAIWQHISESTLAQVMACCLMAPSHYLNQCWLIISEVLWQSPRGNFTRYTSATNHQNYLEHYFSKMLLKSSRGQWVKHYHHISRGTMICVWEVLAYLSVVMGARGRHLFVVGSNNSPVFKCSVPSWPPTAYSLPGKTGAATMTKHMKLTRVKWKQVDLGIYQLLHPSAAKGQSDRHVVTGRTNGNKANLRDLLAATGLVILLKLD